MAFRKTKLENGITVITDRIPGTNSVSAGVWIRSGSRDEEAATGGISHFIEHSLFHGSANFSGDEITSGMESLGATIDAETGRDYTSYSITVLGEHLKNAFPMLLDMVANPTFEAADIARERKIIIQEIYEQGGDHSENTRQKIFANSLGKTAFARPIRGTVSKVSNISRDTIAAWHGMTYRGSSMIVSAAGNVRHGDIVNMARTWLGHLPKGRRHTRRRLPFKPAAHWTHTVDQNAGILLLMPAPVKDAKTFFLGNLYEHYLGTGLSSRLYKRLCIEEGISYNSTTLQQAWNKTAFMECEFDCPPNDRLTDAVSIALEEIRMAPDLMTKEDLDRARNIEMKQVLSTYDSAEDRAAHNAGSYMDKGYLLTQRETQKLLRSIKIEDLRGYARHLVKQRLLSIGGYGPKTGERHFERAKQLVDAF